MIFSYRKKSIDGSKNEDSVLCNEKYLVKRSQMRLFLQLQKKILRILDGDMLAL